MPDRFKVTKTDAPEIDATYNSILKDEEAAAVLGKLLPPTNTIDSSEKKGKFRFLCAVLFLLLLLLHHFIAHFVFPFPFFGLLRCHFIRLCLALTSSICFMALQQPTKYLFSLNIFYSLHLPTPTVSVSLSVIRWTKYQAYA